MPKTAIIKSNKSINATASTTTIPNGCLITFEARGDKDRNKDYTIGIEVILERLASLNAILEDAFVDTRTTRSKGLSVAARRLQLTTHAYPVLLGPHTQIVALRKELQADQGKIGRAPNAKGSGNSTKRFTLRVRWSATQIPADANDILLQDDIALVHPNTAPAFPAYGEMWPELLLELYRRGGTTSTSDKNASGNTVFDELAERFELTEELLSVTFMDYGRERSKWQNMVRWARNDLRKKGLLAESSKYGLWELTQTGIDRAKELTAEVSLTPTTSTRCPSALTPEQLEERQTRMSEVGDMGELRALEYERERLRKLNKPNLAARIKHTARLNVSAGYDILSFEKDGSERFIEVKSTVANSNTFYLSANELRVARECGQSYWLYRVTQASSDEGHQISCIQDPAKQIDEGHIESEPTAYRCKLPSS